MSDDHEVRVREMAYHLWLAAGSPEGRDDEFWHQAEQSVRQTEGQVDDTVSQTFPASDPPAASGITGADDAASTTVATPTLSAAPASAKPASAPPPSAAPASAAPASAAPAAPATTAAGKK